MGFGIECHHSGGRIDLRGILAFNGRHGACQIRGGSGRVPGLMLVVFQPAFVRSL